MTEPCTMKDRTPERFRCAIAASCSAVFEKCAAMASCPGVIDKGATLVIIGKHVTSHERPELAGRVGVDETAIEISAELVREALACPVVIAPDTFVSEAKP